MIIDCASCVGRPTECGDCVVSVILGSHPQGVEVDDDMQTAMAVLAGSGMVPPLRLMPMVQSSDAGPPVTSAPGPDGRTGGAVPVRGTAQRRRRAG